MGHQKTSWAVRVGEHPCGMLSFNDKWWMTHHDKKYLSRLGHKRREELSCIPLEFRDGSWHKYSAERRCFLSSWYTLVLLTPVCLSDCIYCNGTYGSA